MHLIIGFLASKKSQFYAGTESSTHSVMEPATAKDQSHSPQFLDFISACSQAKEMSFLLSHPFLHSHHDTKELFHPFLATLETILQLAEPARSSMIATYLSSRNIQNRTPLHVACLDGRLEFAVQLLKLGKSVSHLDYNLNTPLHLAAQVLSD